MNRWAILFATLGLLALGVALWYGRQALKAPIE